MCGTHQPYQSAHLSTRTSTTTCCCHHGPAHANQHKGLRSTQRSPKAGARNRVRAAPMTAVPDNCTLPKSSALSHHLSLGSWTIVLPCSSMPIDFEACTTTKHAPCSLDCCPGRSASFCCLPSTGPKSSRLRVLWYASAALTQVPYLNPSRVATLGSNMKAADCLTKAEGGWPAAD